MYPKAQPQITPKSQPRTDMWAVLAGLGLALVLGTAGAQDQYFYVDNGIVRVGVDLTRGGSIGYLAASATPAYNVINCHGTKCNPRRSPADAPPRVPVLKVAR